MTITPSPLLLLALLLTLPPTATATAAQPYNSLADFCTQTKADTPIKCQCGQAELDKSMPKKDQAIVLAAMSGDPAARQKAQDLMPKFSEAIAKCK